VARLSVGWVERFGFGVLGVVVVVVPVTENDDAVVADV
jgi:hypothetical protein